jgi:hypothetical protein
MREIDILLPFHRVDKFLNLAIASIFASKNVRPRIILIDDRPNKNNKVEFSLDSPIKIVKNELPSGYGNALKTGSLHIQTEFVALMNSDDTIEKDKLSRQLKALESCDLSITNIRRITPRGFYSKSLAGELTSSEYSTDFLSLGSYGANATWAMSSSWWKQQVLDNHQCLDWRIALSIFDSTKISYIPTKLYNYRRHSMQTNYSNLTTIEFDKLYRSWATFVSKYAFLPQPDLEYFSFFAAPWAEQQKINLVKMFNWSDSFINSSIFRSYEIQRNLQMILNRRFLIALRNENFTVKEKLVLAKSGSPEACFLIKDLISNKIQTLFRI